jgi:hypothetical protein
LSLGENVKKKLLQISSRDLPLLDFWPALIINVCSPRLVFSSRFLISFDRIFFFSFAVFVKELRHLVVDRASEWMDTFIRAAHYSSSLVQSSEGQSVHKTLVLAQQLFGKIKESWRSCAVSFLFFPFLVSLFV